jgi:nucleoside-diphosphate-sugar epimerase
VRALVRPTSDVAFLRGLGVELASGDLQDLPSLRAVVAGADVVFHCAAKVGEWGSWSEYQTQIIDATRNLLEACRTVGVARVLHVSSITVYGHPARRGADFTEDEPLGQNLWLWDHYCRAKIRAEELVRQYPGDATIIRPSWIYGPRDRHTLPRLIKALRAGRIWVTGSGQNLLNLVYVGDVAAGAILAAQHASARGQAYNLSSEGEITQRQFFDTVTALIGLRPLRWRMPFVLAFWAGLGSEVLGRAVRLRRPPHVTRYGVSLIGRPTQFSTSKARSQLGWRPQVPVAEGLRRTVQWLQECEPALVGAVPAKA